MTALKNKSLFPLILSMVIFGSVGIFVSFLPSELSRGFAALSRSVAAFVFLFVFCLISRRPPSLRALCRNPLLLPLSGVALGMNWVLLFEAYKRTSVSAATLCYYLAPILVILLSVPIFGERLTLKKLLCAAAALLGCALVSGVFSDDLPFSFVGLLPAFGAAILYAAVVLCSKGMKEIGSLEKTVWQMGFASAVLLVYTLLSRGFPAPSLFDLKTVLLLLALGVLHTGIAYALYFSALSRVPAQNAAIVSYVDPAVALIFSAWILRERPGVFGYLGALLILGSAAVCELDFKNFKRKSKKKNG